VSVFSRKENGQERYHGNHGENRGDGEKYEHLGEPSNNLGIEAVAKSMAPAIAVGFTPAPGSISYAAGDI